MQPLLTLKPLYHRGQESIGIYFPFNGEITDQIKIIKGARWSRTNACWYLPLTKEHYQELIRSVAHLATIDSASLRQYLEQRKVLLHCPAPKQAIPKTTNRSQADRMIHHPLCTPNLQALQNYLEQLRLKAYSPSTICTYRKEFLALLYILKHREATSLTVADLRRYFLYCLEKEKLSEATIHSRINALKFYYEQVLGREKMFFEIPRPKKSLHLPKVLGESELGRLFNAIRNHKHKAILFTAYSSGLRVSEVVNLELKHIDSSRMQILIQRAKGKKDRYVNLSPVLLDVLRSYIRECTPRPQKYLFEGPVPGTPYSKKSAQRVFQTARQQAGILKEVSFHSLRHSFATHLLEKGVDIRYIKDLLGHFSIKTTERYLHVKREQLVNIVSPLDDLWCKQELEW